ncbi:type II toxin-antitoxin system RelE/ParE family toxin (plasmid) [Tolypothrix sp. PCC 7910]|uniref:type II toxin-antitoxin system RelE/ParE family toxin n=1 Tax=Tolypothrix sp. PCC 7910 TaxID=2099387 RepID=UPI0014276F91|nr:type II toxin-antitoxin system RelE/ParE family toxin [Tolypothrix sp. PCC 7910]QIR41902.1 type II toxin-antitoxin system RelE/ParE family toxin [Tolypothrix sp. PCC 7910]
MKELRVTKEAKGDLADIWWYVAQNNEPAADAIIDKLMQKFDELLVTPEIGRARTELAPKLRSIPVGKYLIFYRPIAEGIEIVRVIHGARDIESLFEEP